MPVMLSSRNLLSSPGGNATNVVVPQGKAVDIVDNTTNPAFVQIKFMNGNDQRAGWVSVFAVDPSTNAIGGALDKLVFADACVGKAVMWGISAHYLMSVAEMRTKIIDDTNQNGDIGPFALSSSEWAFYGGLPQFNLGVTANDINNWRLQCVVFAVMILKAQEELTTAIGDQPTFSQLYAAQILGTKVAASGFTNPAQTVANLIATTAPTDFTSEGIEGSRILTRYQGLLQGATMSVALQRIDASLQQALDTTKPFIVKLTGGQPADGAVVSGAGGILGELIAAHEGGRAGYNAFNRGGAGDSSGQSIDFSKLTIENVMIRQKLPHTDAQSLFAVGKYQLIPQTMASAVRALDLQTSSLLTPSLQERLFRNYLVGTKRPAVRAFVASGNSSGLRLAQIALAQEFASVGMPDTGISFYAGQAGNKASITPETVKNALLQEHSAYLQNLMKGQSSDEAWAALSPGIV